MVKIHKVLTNATGGTVVYIDNDGVMKIREYFAPETEAEVVRSLKKLGEPAKVETPQVDESLPIDDSEEYDDDQPESISELRQPIDLQQDTFTVEKKHRGRPRKIG